MRDKRQTPTGCPLSLNPQPSTLNPQPSSSAQRQLYAALLLTTIVLGAALYMRPTVAQELMALAGFGTSPQGSGPQTEDFQAMSTVAGTGFPAFSRQQAPAVQYSPVAAPPAAQSGPQYGCCGGSTYPAAGGATYPAPADARYPIAGRNESPVSQWPESGPPEQYPVAETRPVPSTPQPSGEIAAPGLPYTEPWSAPRSDQSMPYSPSPAGPYAARQPAAYPDPPAYARPADPSVYGPPADPRGYGPSPVPPDYAPQHSPVAYGQPFNPPSPGQGQINPEASLDARAKPCEGAERLGQVGDEVILACEILPTFNEIMARIPESELAQFSQSELERQKKALMARLLDGHVKTKLLYQDAKRTIPKEALPKFEERIGEYFEKEELPKQIEKAGVANRRELEEKLQAIGSSLERTKRSYVEMMLAQQWLQEQKGPQREVAYADMLDYYQEHVADFETPARARWELLTVRVPRYSDGSEARARLAQMGNQVMQGMSVDDVLGAQPRGDLECRGGTQGWVTQGSLQVTPAMEQAIFGLPVGSLSQIFYDDGAYHIVRVLQREEFKRKSFEEAQSEIREKIQELRRQQEIEAYLARLRTRIPVWTVFDDDPELAELRRQSDAVRK
jgi:hypothetical protein